MNDYKMTLNVLYGVKTYKYNKIYKKNNTLVENNKINVYKLIIIH